jgi:hypothetical protein
MKIFYSVKTGMNRFGSHPNHENRPVYEGPRLMASQRHGRQRVFFEFFSHRSAAQQALFWGGANNRTRWVEGQQSRMLSEYYDFI